MHTSCSATGCEGRCGPPTESYSSPTSSHWKYWAGKPARYHFENICLQPIEKTMDFEMCESGRVKPGHDGGRVRCGRDDGRRVGPARDGSGRDMPGHHAGSDRIAPARDGDARI